MINGSSWGSQEHPIVGVAKRGPLQYSETFIRAHLEHLNAKLMIIDKGWVSPFLSLTLNAPKAFRFLLDAVIWATQKRFLRQNGIHVVLAEFGPTGVALMRLCQRASVKLIVQFHGKDAYQHAVLNRAGLRYPELFDQAAAIIVVSRHMESQLTRLGAPRRKLHYIPYGVDPSLFHGANPAKASPVFVAVGRFVAKKAPQLTIRAFKKVHEHAPAARLIMVGDGPLWRRCKLLSERLGIADAVTFLGARSHCEVAAILKGARAFVQHSIRAADGDAEGTPVAVLEAGAAGLPVIATRHGGIQDVVIDKETGFLVDEGDVNGMAEAMVRVAMFHALAARLGHAARERVLAEFSLEKNMSALRQIITTVFQEHRIQT